jgi:hypothetical protein
LNNFPCYLQVKRGIICKLSTNFRNRKGLPTITASKEGQLSSKGRFQIPTIPSISSRNTFLIQIFIHTPVMQDKPEFTKNLHKKTNSSNITQLSRVTNFSSSLILEHPFQKGEPSHDNKTTPFETRNSQSLRSE